MILLYDEGRPFHIYILPFLVIYRHISYSHVLISSQSFTHNKFNQATLLFIYLDIYHFLFIIYTSYFYTGQSFLQFNQPQRLQDYL